jgi:hypothetical protein
VSIKRPKPCPQHVFDDVAIAVAIAFIRTAPRRAFSGNTAAQRERRRLAKALAQELGKIKGLDQARFLETCQIARQGTDKP